MTRINVGCGETPTRGWSNYDGAFTLRLLHHPVFCAFAGTLGILGDAHRSYMALARKENIQYGNAARRLPIEDGQVEVLYSCHMVEHLEREEARRFLAEALRVLCPGGIIRIVVPDIRKLVAEYTRSGDADAFMAATFLCVRRPDTWKQRLRTLAGLRDYRQHLWMYDGDSLSRLLSESGFTAATVLPAGETRISRHEPLDLYEREAESVYVEAEKPRFDSQVPA